MSVAVSGLARTYLSLKMLRPLFSIAPMLKSDTATTLKTSRSYSRPKTLSSQRIERSSGAALLSRLDVDGDLDGPAARGSERLADAGEAAADHRKEIGRLRKRVVPDRVVPIGPADHAGFDGIAVSEQDGRFLARRFDARGVHGEDIGTVEEICDAAKAFGLALRAVRPARSVQPHQLRVGRRIDLRLERQREGSPGRGRDDQSLRRRGKVSGRDRASVEGGCEERQLVAVQHEGCVERSCRVGAQRQHRRNPRLRRVQAYIQIDAIDEEVARPVLVEPDDRRIVAAHGAAGSLADHPIWRSATAPVNAPLSAA